MKTQITDEKYIELYLEGKTDTEIALYFGVSVRAAQRRGQKLRAKNILKYRVDSDILKENVRLTKQTQKIQDLNRIKNKSFREHARIENAVAELQSKLIELIETKTLPKSAYKGKKIAPSKTVGAVVHFTDLHFNELINLMCNKYDFTVAAQRLRKYVQDAKVYLKARNVKDICIAMTGDLMNSDRRLDELLSQATNRAKAVLLSTTLLEQVLLDFQLDFNLSVAHVIGNESRITKDVGWEEEVASDNYDTIIHGILKQIFKKSNINFIEGSSTEKVIEITGQNILLIHGNQMKSTNMCKSIQSMKGKYAAEGIIIDFVISGHYHNSKTGDTYSQASSLAGANAYSRDALQLESRASQNLHIFYSNGNRDSIKIDLQHVDGVEGYPINQELECYNAKSVNKAKKKTTIHKIVI